MIFSSVRSSCSNAGRLRRKNKLKILRARSPFPLGESCSIYFEMPKLDKIQPLQIYQLLPRTDCQKCGSATCLAFAFELISREKKLSDCPDLLTEAFRDSYEFLSQYFGEEEAEVSEMGLLITREKCSGCGDCAVVCNKALSTIMYSGMVLHRDPVPPVLKVVDGTVQVIEWTSCKRCMDPPDYCRLCEEKCTFGALELVR